MKEIVLISSLSLLVVSIVVIIMRVRKDEYHLSSKTEQACDKAGDCDENDKDSQGNPCKANASCGIWLDKIKMCRKGKIGMDKGALACVADRDNVVIGGLLVAGLSLAGIVTSFFLKSGLKRSRR